MSTAVVAMVECKTCAAHFDPKLLLRQGAVVTLGVCPVCGGADDYEFTDRFVRPRPLVVGVSTAT